MARRSVQGLVFETKVHVEMLNITISSKDSALCSYLESCQAEIQIFLIFNKVTSILLLYIKSNCYWAPLLSLVCSTTHQTAWRLDLNSGTSAAPFCNVTGVGKESDDTKLNLHKATLRWNVAADSISQWIKMTPSIFAFWLSLSLLILWSQGFSGERLTIKCSLTMRTDIYSTFSLLLVSSPLPLLSPFLFLSSLASPLPPIHRKSINPASTLSILSV